MVRAVLSALLAGAGSALAAGRELHFVSVETQGDPLLAKVGPPSYQVHNPGKGQEWKGYRSKPELLLPFLRTLPDQDLVAFADGSDIMWGGGDPADFLHAYETIANRSGAPVVFSASMYCWTQACAEVPPVPAWAYELAGSRDLGGGFWDSLAPGCANVEACGDPGVRGECCSRPVAFKFLNSGFFMGPVHKVVKMVEWGISNYDGSFRLKWGANGHDQSVFAQYWFDHPREITLDYASTLCFTYDDLLSSDLLSVDAERRIVLNNAFRRVQFLIHNPGPPGVTGQPLVSKLAEQLAAASGPSPEAGQGSGAPWGSLGLPGAARGVLGRSGAPWGSLRLPGAAWGSLGFPGATEEGQRKEAKVSVRARVEV